MTEKNKGWIPLSRAAHQRGLSYAQMYRLVLKGDIQGEQRGSRWYVRESHLKRLDGPQHQGRAGRRDG